MNIWLITVGEPLPTDGGNKRLLRTGILAGLLVEKGHSVTWWSSTFDHVLKVHRCDRNKVFDIADRFKLILLHAMGYNSNVSLRRIMNHYGIARKFRIMSASYRKPDVILCSLPTLELSLAATEYGKLHGVPVILDIRDLWPDVLTELVPTWARSMARVILSPLYRTAHAACAKATAIIGTTPAFVEWGLDSGHRSRTPWDKDFPMGYSESVPNKDEIEAAQRRWDQRGVKKDDFNICFFGTIGRQFELDTVIAAAKILEGQHRPFRFILCGDGDNLTRYREEAANCKIIAFPGWVNSADIWTLMRMSRIGLAPYQSIPNFTKNLPNKPLEYLSAGLPIVSCLQGILKDLLHENQCGMTYANGNAQELSAILVRLYDDPDTLLSMSRRALSVFQQKYTATNVYGDLISYLSSVVENH